MDTVEDKLADTVEDKGEDKREAEQTIQEEFVDIKTVIGKLAFETKIIEQTENRVKTKGLCWCSIQPQEAAHFLE